ncbi:hypothetical protein F1D61_07910 [Methylobacterium aquaticum]|nr:hypothetical protein F1D61_07910 [Methylobacterium aquaticum]
MAHLETPPHPRSGCASASSVDDRVAGALSPPAGRGGNPRHILPQPCPLQETNTREPLGGRPPAESA